MTLEYIGAVEALFSRRSGTGTESTHHCPFVMGQCVSIFVIFACKPLEVVFAVDDRAFFRSLALVGQHVSPEILEGSAAVGPGASSFLATFIFYIGVAG
jgi:hypothetical protein